MKNRRSIRLQSYDYSQPGAYFVTICTREKECLLGQIQHGQVVLSGAGEIARAVWSKLPGRFPLVSLDEYVVMPNHVHGIFLVGAQFIAPVSSVASDSKEDMTDRVYTLGEIVRTYKATVTRLVRTRYDVNTDKGGMNPAPTAWFGWQRNYYERVIRNESELSQVRQYIVDNPAKWDMDEENPDVRPAKS